MLILPRRVPWTSQPQVVVGIDWSNPLTRGLVFATEGSIPSYDLAASKPGNPIGSGVSLGVGANGGQINFSGTVADGAYSFGSRVDLAGGTDATWDILIYFNSANPSTHFFGQWDSPNQWLLQASSGVLVWVAAQDGSGNRRRWDTTSSIFTTSGWYRVIASWLGAANKILVVNGVDKSSSLVVVNAVATAINTASSNLEIGTAVGGADLNGAVAFARIWKRGLSLAECMSLAATPWQIFAP